MTPDPTVSRGCHLPELKLPRRDLGNTGLRISVLGLGGFHQVEASQDTIAAVVDRYLAAGGNYVETAPSYGRGASELKLGRALADRRTDVILASKTTGRSCEEAWSDLNQSLERLRTSHLDILFIHNISDPEQLDAVCAGNGALKAFLRARDEGLVRFFGFSSHWPHMYVTAAERLPLDAALVWGNYLDFCNFPEIPRTVLPALRKHGIAVLLMKPLADGFLYRSPRPALRYALMQDADCLVSGFNSVALLEDDLAACSDPRPVGSEEIESILRDAPELGGYVCRQCEHCTVCENGATLKRVFELEGKVDRQMDDRRPVDAAQYALRERLKGWFGTQGRARTVYAQMRAPAQGLLGADLQPCRYGIDIRRKLRLAHAKLSADGRPELL